MNMMATALRAVLFGLLVFSLLAVSTARYADAAQYPAQWIGPMADGCMYYSDGDAAYWAACPRNDGTTGIVQTQNGTWVYFARAWFDANGWLNVVLADNTYLVIGVDGSEVIYRTDGTSISIPPYTGECGDYCQTNLGGLVLPE